MSRYATGKTFLRYVTFNIIVMCETLFFLMHVIKWETYGIFLMYRDKTLKYDLSIYRFINVCNNFRTTKILYSFASMHFNCKFRNKEDGDLNNRIHKHITILQVPLIHN